MVFVCIIRNTKSSVSRKPISFLFSGIRRELEKVKKARIDEKAKEKQMYARMFAS